MTIEWTSYLKYRSRLRGFEIAHIETIVRYSNERYIDHATGRLVAVGRHGSQLIMVPYEIDGATIRPVTVHAVTRPQIVARIKSGRFTHE